MHCVKLYLGVAVVFAVALQLTECMCQMRHPQQQYCSADFVVLAGIREVQLINEDQITKETHYIVNIKRAFKFSEAYQNATKTVIISPAAGNLEVYPRLQSGTDYLITGVIFSDKMYTSYCDWVKPWKELTNTQRNGIRKKYRNGCECQFTICNGERCENQDLSSCVWDMDVEHNCQRDFGICKKTKRGCDWVETNLFVNCTMQAFGFGELITPDDEFPQLA